MLGRPYILLFGDSLTQRGFESGGWVERLAHVFSRRADVINRGLSGYNSRWARPALDRLLTADRSVPSPPLLVVLWFGANDACLADRSSSRQHVPLGEYRSNIKALTGVFREHGCLRILLVSPPPPHTQSRMSWLSATYGSNAPAECPIDPVITEQYAAACRDAAAEAGTAFLDLFKAMTAPDEIANLEGYLCDGLHFSAAGQEFVYHKIMEAVTQSFPEIVPKIDEHCNPLLEVDDENPILPIDLPLHKVLQPDDFEDAFRVTHS